MGMIATSLILIAAFALLAAPAVLAYRARRGAGAAGALYALLGGALLVYHLGSPLQSRLPDAGDLRPAGAGPTRSQCQQALDVAERGGIIVSRSDPERMIVNPEGWRQLPEQAQAALVTCAEGERPTGSGQGPMEVVFP